MTDSNSASPSPAPGGVGDLADDEIAKAVSRMRAAINGDDASFEEGNPFDDAAVILAEYDRLRDRSTSSFDDVRAVATAICKSLTCEGTSCCQWPAQRGRTQCPVKTGAYDHAARDAIAALRTASESAGGQARTIEEWQPIETAPKDGTDILTLSPNGVRVARYSPMALNPEVWVWFIALENAGTSGTYCHPTHWQPLPRTAHLLRSAASAPSVKPDCEIEARAKLRDLIECADDDRFSSAAIGRGFRLHIETFRALSVTGEARETAAYPDLNDAAHASPSEAIVAGGVREALDNSQSLLAMIYQLNTNGSVSEHDWENEGLSDLITKQIAENRAALSAIPAPELQRGTDWDDVRGIAPDATGGLSSEDFVRKLRSEWPDRQSSPSAIEPSEGE